MTTKEEAYRQIEQLVERFEQQYSSYKKADYNETLTRRDFIDPFFKALGWDIDNEQGYAEAYREVIHEDKVKVGKATKAPDYSFRLGGGKRLFFVEAKKPSVFIKDEILPAYQVRRYGWSAKLAVSVITDFEEFAIYDCTKKPLLNDKASVARIKYITYKDYLKEFDFIWNTFSKEHVLKGSFDKFVQSDTHKKGTATVDKAFLESLDSWRTYLATSIAKNNLNLDEDEINFAVQQTIDRFIFLRIAEDRGVEVYGNLQNALAKGDYYHNLFSIFLDADKKYNSGLFDFKKDKISSNLKVDNKVIKTIVSELYYPESPYEFSVLSVEILGSAYEQFLGKVIRITAGHHAKIEEKPEVRKAGGVYYTPQYIVDYIVKNTVGKLIEAPFEGGRGMTPKQVEALKIVDPACGSGSFLLGAYQFLLDYHRQYYKPEFEKLTAIAADTKRNSKERNDAIKERNKLPVNPTGELSTRLKKQILLNNIYGVDIDVNAVEVTKLSLLLKCMEGETQSSITNEMTFGERVLPTLDGNIKSGNSLIDTDYYNNQFDFGEEKKIKPFNWKKAFPDVFKPVTKTKAHIFKPDMGIDEVQTVEEPMMLYNETYQGGFDVVIGNPPWGASFSEDSLNYLREKNREIIVRMIDSFMYFVRRSYTLLKPAGSFGMILPDVLFYQTDNEKLREYILKHSTIEALLNLGDVFDGVTRPSCIIIFTNLPPNKLNKIATVDLTAYKRDNKYLELYNKKNCQSVLQKELREIPNSLFVTNNANHFSIIHKIKSGRIKKLSEFVDEDGIQRGVSPDLKDAFLVTSAQVKEFKLEKSHLRDALTGGKQVKRYHILYPDLQLIYTSRTTDFKAIPNICNFINQFKSRITCKEVKEGKHSLYALHRAREEKIFTKSEKLVGVITEDEIIVSLENKKTFVTDGLYLFGVKGINSKYVMGVLNSKLFVFLYRLTTMEGGRALAQVKPTVVSEMPIRIIDEKNKTEKAEHDFIIKNVDLLLTLNAELQTTKLDTKAEQLKARIEHAEEEINKAVYKLYELTEEEIAIIETK